MKRISLRQLRYYWPIFLLIVPTFALVGIFAYIPAWSAIYHSFFRWDGADVLEYVGVKNYRLALLDEDLAQAFGLVLIFIAANLVKMTPSILIAVLIHRLVSSRWRYIYRVAFVMPMVIPAMVWLLVWKFIYNPEFGALNWILRVTTLMDALQWLDKTMPQLAAALAPLHTGFLRPVFGTAWGYGLFGGLLLALLGGMKKPLSPTQPPEQAGSELGQGFLEGMGQSLRAIRRGWLWWLGLALAGWFLWGPVRMLLLVPYALVCVQLLRWLPAGREMLKFAGLFVVVSFVAIVLLSMTWTQPIGVFQQGAPPWLSQPKLIPAALIFWGFPWVGIVSVLLYLSGLGNIDQSVYEAAEVDGCGWLRKFWNIELPLITTQVRLNLVLMIIGTLKGWGQVFVLLDDKGGPDGAGMLPGLYMFRKAFRDGQAGYASAIGFLLFLLILYLTLINNKYVRVEK
jgi:ABC-type sugar transport system permease subunit